MSRLLTPALLALVAAAALSACGSGAVVDPQSGAASSTPSAPTTPPPATATRSATARVGCPQRAKQAFSLTTDLAPNVALTDPVAATSAIDAWLDSGRPGYAVLLKSDGTFAQAATDGKRLTVEWRECAPTTFQHLVAAHPDGDMTDHTSIVAAGQGPLDVEIAEVLNVAEARGIFHAFVDSGVRPSGWAWRDVSRMYAPA